MKNIFRKTWIIGIIILFIGASAISSISAEVKTKEIVPTMVDWSDNFDSYENGQFLDGDPEDGEDGMVGTMFQMRVHTWSMMKTSVHLTQLNS